MHTHFIEQFTNKGKLLQGPVQPIKNMRNSLSMTAKSNDLKTIAVWKIKLKNQN